MPGQPMLFTTSPDGLVRPSAAATAGAAPAREVPLPGPATDTSRLAHARAALTEKSKRLAIYDVIAAAGERGLTTDEAEVLLNMPHQTCSARVGELKRLGWIVAPGPQRPTRTGSLADVYVAKTH